MAKKIAGSRGRKKVVSKPAARDKASRGVADRASSKATTQVPAVATRAARARKAVEPGALARPTKKAGVESAVASPRKGVSRLGEKGAPTAGSGSRKPAGPKIGASAGKRARRAKRAKKRPAAFLLGEGPALVFSDADYERAREALMRQDPRLEPIITRAGPLRFRHLQKGGLFPALVETIISQQLSVRVADVIFGRLRTLCPDDDAAAAPFLRDLDITLMRTAGLSEAKARSVQDLAAKVCDGTLDLEHMQALPDEEVVRQLCLVKGIGPWSAHIFLIFRLNRPDVWPIGDLGIVRGLQRLNGWRVVPPLARLEKAGDVYRPYRSIAAWYLWASLSQTTVGSTT